MNELSVEITAKEIHENAEFWHNRAEHNLYRFFLEVKKIRDERLFSELGFSNFDEYCQSAWNLKRRVVDERIQIADTFSEDDFKRYSAQLGHKKTLLLTSMEETQRERTLSEGIPTAQGYKTYDEATQKEIADYKRNAEEMERKAKEYEKQLKQRDELIASREQENEILQSKLEDAESREPETKVIYKEKIPKYIEAQMNDKEQELIEAKQSKLRLEEKIEKLQSSNRKDYLTEDEQIGSRRFQAESDVLDLRDSINDFLKDNAINAFREGAIATSSQRTKDVLEEGIEELEAFCRVMRNSLNNRISINQ